MPTGGGLRVTSTATRPIHQLYDYLDGELTEERRTEIAEHLDYCGPCAEAAGFEAELRQVDRGPLQGPRPRVAPPADRRADRGRARRRPADATAARTPRPWRPRRRRRDRPSAAHHRLGARRPGGPLGGRPDRGPVLVPARARCSADFDELTAQAEELVAEATGLAVATAGRRGQGDRPGRLGAAPTSPRSSGCSARRWPSWPSTAAASPLAGSPRRAVPAAGRRVARR